MDYFPSFFSYLIVVFLVADGFPIMLNESDTNTSIPADSKNDKSTHSRIMKLTAFYLFLVVWIILFAIGFLFYCFLNYFYIPNKAFIKKNCLPNPKRKSQKFYNHINQRYHKNKHRFRENSQISEIIVNKGCSSLKKMSQICKYCYHKCLNKNLSNRKNRGPQENSEEEKGKGICGCCGKSKGSDSRRCSYSKTSIEMYGSQPRRPKPCPMNNIESKPPYNQFSSMPSQQSISRLPDPVVHKITQSPPQSPPSQIVPPPVLNIKPEQQPMYTNPPPSHSQQQPLLPPPRPYSQQQAPYQCNKRNATPVPVQSYGGSTYATSDDQEKSAAKGGCCATKKKSAGAIHAQIHGYKVDGHVRIKGKNNQKTISIPTDTYMLTR